jgi:hypothetical protein
MTVSAEAPFGAMHSAYLEKLLDALRQVGMPEQ